MFLIIKYVVIIYMKSSVKPFDKQVSTTDNLVPTPHFMMLLVGSKGSGKSNLCIHLLLNEYKQVFNKIYFISPTYELDDKTLLLQNSNLLKKNIGLMNAINNDLKKQSFLHYRMLTPDDLESNVYFNITINEEMINNIVTNQKQTIRKYSKGNCDKILILIDDAVCNKYLKTSHFINFILLSRHYNISVIINTQAYYLVAKSLRLNTDCLILFSNPNDTELKDIFNEWNCNMSAKNALALYREVVKTPYNFVQINKLNPTKKYIKNLNQFL